MRTSPYRTKGVVNASGPLAFVALVFLLNVAFAMWVIYLIIKIAAHVGAWPFA